MKTYLLLKRLFKNKQLAKSIHYTITYISDSPAGCRCNEKQFQNGMTDSHLT